MPEVYVAVGSNLNAEHNVTLAVNELDREFSGVRFSPWYRNRAVGFEGEDFINLVAGFTTDLPVDDVLSRLHKIEGLCGRPRDAPRWAPRSMDIDVLIYGDLVRSEPRLKLPRPDLLERAYMLGPLADLAPELIHPTAKLTIRELWERFDRAAHPLERIEPQPMLRPPSTART
jgi:2-amino-4-hydroxy-6-hydroxymethyldihydropteridine diphosphokinase